MNLSEKENRVLAYLVSNFSKDEKPVPFHEHELAIENVPSEEVGALIDGLYEKGLVFISEPEHDETGGDKAFEKQPFILAPDVLLHDY